MARTNLLGWPVRCAVVWTVLGASAHSLAANYCEDLEGNAVFVGEVRYYNDHVAYANSYWGGNGNELTLDTYIGGAYTDATNLRFFVYAHGAELDPAECDEAMSTFDLETSPNRDTAHCPTSPTLYSTDYIVDSCDAGNAGYVYAGKGFGASGLDYARYYRATVSVDSGPDGGDAEASDEACFTLLDDSECTLF